MLSQVRDDATASYTLYLSDLHQPTMKTIGQIDGAAGYALVRNLLFGGE